MDDHMARKQAADNEEAKTKMWWKIGLVVLFCGAGGVCKKMRGGDEDDEDDEDLGADATESKLDVETTTIANPVPARADSCGGRGQGEL
jgi:hypothetical protein